MEFITSGTIIGMTVVGISCCVLEKVLNACGKVNESQCINVAGYSSIGTSAIMCIAKLIEALKVLG